MRRELQLRSWAQDHWLEVVMGMGFIAVLLWFGLVVRDFLPKPVIRSEFDGEKAYSHVLAQLEVGPRPTGSEANRHAGDYIIQVLQEHGWKTEVQEFVYMNTQARNIIGKMGSGPVLILGTHYDTRRQADNDPIPALRQQPVPGANDGGSGTGVLLEIARVLANSSLTNEVWLVFFDAEDNGGLEGWDYAAGSRFMAENLTIMPQSVVIIDMIGDTDQQIYKEHNSTRALQDQIWAIAADLGYEDYFRPEYKWSILDDHTAFLLRDISAVDIIDFDYTYWHTTQDTADKIAPESLERVGRVLQTLVERSSRR